MRENKSSNVIHITPVTTAWIDPACQAAAVPEGRVVRGVRDSCGSFFRPLGLGQSWDMGMVCQGLAKEPHDSSFLSWYLFVAGFTNIWAGGGGSPKTDRPRQRKPAGPWMWTRESANFLSSQFGLAARSNARWLGLLWKAQRAIYPEAGSRRSHLTCKK